MIYLLAVLIGASGAIGDILLYRGAKSHSLGILGWGLTAWLVSLLLFVMLVWRWRCPLSFAFLCSAACHLLLVVAIDLVQTHAVMNHVQQLGLVFTVLGLLMFEAGNVVGQRDQGRTNLATTGIDATDRVKGCFGEHPPESGCGDAPPFAVHQDRATP